MAKSTTFTITGVRELQRAYRELPKRLANKVIRQAVRKALKPVAARVKELTPKETGLLAKATKVKARAKKKRGTIALDVVQGEGSFKGQTFYGGFQNFGTKKLTARHYVERAFDDTKEAAAAQVASEIAGGIVRELVALAGGGTGLGLGSPSGSSSGSSSGAPSRPSLPRARDERGRFLSSG